jgi:membrane protease YdiL (CAAX protease family)
VNAPVGLRGRARDAALATAAWCAGFLWVGRGGSWLPLAALALAVAGWRVAKEPGTRALLAPGGRWLAIGLGAGVLQTSATLLLYRPAAEQLPGLREATRHLYAVLGGSGLGPVAASALVGLVVLAEEVAWRGALLERAGRSRLVALSALYAACHAPSGSPLLVAVAFACGLYWGAIRLATGSIFAAATAHLLWDAALLVGWPLER